MNHALSALLGAILLSPYLWSQTTPPGPVTPQPTPKPTLNRNRLDAAVRRATNDYVRDVLESVGDAYQVRYNIREGLLRAMSRIGNYEIESIVQNSADYQNAVATGRAQGKTDGAAAGRQSANSLSHSVASSQINAAIDRTLDTGAKIQFTQVPTLAAFHGSSSNVSSPQSIESRWRENEYSKISQIRRLLKNEPPSEYMSGLFDLASIYRGHSTRLPTDLDAPRAFRTWYDNDLRSHSSAATDGRNFYKEITNASLFDQAIQNGELFKNEFNRNIDNGTSGSLERQWDRRITAPHQGALNLGETLYLQEAASYAHDRGFHKGYHEVFSDASIVSFNQNYQALYRANFSAIENRVRTSPAITEIQARVTSEDGKAEVTFGDTFNVVITNIANRGMVADDINVDIANQNQITSFNAKESVRIPGLTRLKETHVIQRLAWLSAITKPDQDIVVTATVHTTPISLRIKATYEELLRKAVRSPAADVSLWTMNLALDFMKKQYDDLSGFNDQYEKRDPSMLLVRLRTLFDSMTETEKAQLRSHGQLIRNVFGGKPVRFLNPKRDEWDASQAMIDEMGLPGVVPKEVNGSENINTNPYTN